MKISQISLALFAVALAGCGSNSATTPTAPETVGNSPAMMETPANAVAPDAMASNSAMSDMTTNSTAMSNSAMSDMTTNSTAMSSDNYRVRGQVVEVMPGAEGSASLMVKHEEIPGFMKAMQMRVPLANAADAGKVKAGDKIAFDMKKSNTEVSNIEMLPPSTALKLAN